VAPVQNWGSCTAPAFACGASAWQGPPSPRTLAGLRRGEVKPLWEGVWLEASFDHLGGCSGGLVVDRNRYPKLFGVSGGIDLLPFGLAGLDGGSWVRTRRPEQEIGGDKRHQGVKNGRNDFYSRYLRHFISRCGLPALSLFSCEAWKDETAGKGRSLGLAFAGSKPV